MLIGMDHSAYSGQHAAGRILDDEKGIVKIAFRAKQPEWIAYRRFFFLDIE